MADTGPYVTSNPSEAKVYLNSYFQGSTPVVTGLITKAMTLKLTKSGYKDYTRSVSSSNNNGKINVTLTEIEAPTPPIPEPELSTKAQIYITSIPSGARIYGDGVDTGLITPATWWPEVGYHEITVKLEGYYDRKTTGTFAAGQFSAPAAFELRAIEPPAPPTKTWWELLLEFLFDCFCFP